MLSPSLYCGAGPENLEVLGDFSKNFNKTFFLYKFRGFFKKI